MAGSTYGKHFTITTWGESHGQGIGVVVDGCPAGLDLCEEDIQEYLNRRKPGQSKYSTPRKEDDEVEILSGTFEGKTTGTPISMVVYNKTQRSGDYGEIANFYRPGHADLTYDIKYGFRDYRGGGRSSGRETIGRVAGGAIAAKILDLLGVHLLTYTTSIGAVKIDPNNFDTSIISQNPLYMPDAKASEEAAVFLETCMKDGNSSGGTIECIVKNMIPGIGDPVFEKLSANLGKAIFSIGGVKSFEIGDGKVAAEALGSQNNDQYTLSAEGHRVKLTNHSGGILGGISDGSNLVLKIGIKPTPSIKKEQATITRDNKSITVNIKGRHDPVIVPRAVVVVEAMTAITILDMLFASMNSRMDRVVEFFKR